MCRLPCRLNPPHSLSLWNGMPHLVEEIAYHLYDDTPTLQHLALTARVFGVAAQKTLFKNFDLLDEAAVYKWRIRMIEFSAYHGPDTAPFFFRHIKHFSFTLGTNQFRASYIIDFINRVKGRLTGLETVDIYGYDGLSCLWPPCGWFSSFINTTRPIALSFNGTLVPEYILEFGFSSLRSIHFNVCRIYYLDEDNKHKEARQPTLDAKLRLRQGGTRWERVEEIISSALNCETMRLVKDGVEIDSLGLRMISNKLNMNATPEMAISENIYGLRYLFLQVPIFSVTSIPQFVQTIIRKAPSLQRIEIFYEVGWDRLFSWTHILHQALSALLYSLFSLTAQNLREVIFRFANRRNLPRIWWKDNCKGIYISAGCDNERPPCVPEEPLPFGYMAPFTYQSLSDVAIN